MSLKKIALLKSHFCASGGLEKKTLELAKALSGCGHEVFLLTQDDLRHEQLPFQIVSIPGRKPHSFFNMIHFDRGCRKAIMQNRFDAVFGLERHFVPQTYYRAGNGCHRAWLEIRKEAFGPFRRASFYFNPCHRLILEMEKQTFLHPGLRYLFCNSFLVADQIAHYYPQIDKSKLIVIHNGTNIEKSQRPFLESLTGQETRKRSLGLDPEKFQFLFIGHEYERKGLKLLLEALALLPQEGWQLSVVGKDRKIEFFKKRAKELSLKNVFFFGQQKDPTCFFQIADCCVIPSYYDPFANVTLEALAMGVPVITSSKNGASEIVKEPFQGQIFSNFSPLTLASMLHDAMAFPKKEARAIDIRKSVLQYDEKKQLSALLSFLE